MIMWRLKVYEEDEDEEDEPFQGGRKVAMIDVVETGKF